MGDFGASVNARNAEYNALLGANGARLGSMQGSGLSNLEKGAAQS